MPTMKRMLGSRAALALGIIESAHDISERKQAEEALWESEKFTRISASAQDAIVMMDSEGNISFWSEAPEAIFGYSSQEALSKGLQLQECEKRDHDFQ